MNSDPVRLLPSLSRPFLWVAERLRHREDSEHEQALIRIGLGGLITTYLIQRLFHDDVVTVAETWSLGVGLGFFAVAFALFAAILVRPAPSAWRRVAGALTDLATNTSLMCLMAGEATPLYIVYLWVTFGNGFRYGRRYLLMSGVFSATGFLLVVMVTPYWHRDLPLTFALMTGLVVLPFYADLLLRKLVAAIAQAKQASAAKSQFLANMSHEVRTPLNGILGAVSLARGNDAVSPEVKDHLETISGSAQALLALVSNILDAAKLEAGRLEAKNQPFDLHLLLRQVTEMFGAQARSRGVSLFLWLDPLVPPHISGDETYLRQVLMNLLGNAVKFTEEGEISVTARTVEVPSEERFTLHVEVRDTGIGIPQGSQPRVFERFMQVDDSVTRRYGGTGLGTAIARELVELMGGQIGLTSEPGVGSCFWFEIPIDRRVEALSPVPLEGPLRSRRILVVCPDANLGARLRQYVQGWHLTCELARNVAQAIAHLVSSTAGSRQFDVVIVCSDGLDVGPYEFVSIVAADASLSSTPLVLITADAHDHAETAVKRGFETVLAAPPEKSALYNAIHYAAVGENSPGVIPLRAPPSPATKAKPRRLLLAEDNAVNRKVLSQILQKAGHSVHVVPDGDAALEVLQEHPFDVVLLDLHMPGMSGIEVAKAYCFMTPSTSRAPMLALTADAFPETERRCRAVGMMGLVTKPVDSAVLLARIEEVAGGRQPRKEFSPSVAPSTAPPEDQRPEVLVDLSLLREYAALDSSGAFVRELVDVFVQEGATHLEGIEIAARTADWSTLRQRARELRVSAEPLGARSLCLAASSLEKMPPDGLKDNALRLVDDLRETFRAVENTLQEALLPSAELVTHAGRGGSGS